jgi:acyl-CoA reductase-like NAD-dependent aldehyde dehydrogenase
LGVTAGICPHNFPMMIPLWMAPLSIVCGNSMVLKPSEKGPGASMILARLAQQAGIPDGVLQVRVFACPFLSSPARCKPPYPSPHSSVYP